VLCDSKFDHFAKVFEGVLATIITGVVGGLLLGYLIEHIGFYLFSFFIFLLAPIVIALMGTRKVIIHGAKKKVRRYTRLYLCMVPSPSLNLLLIPLKGRHANDLLRCSTARGTANKGSTEFIYAFTRSAG